MLIDSLRPSAALPHLCQPVLCNGAEFPLPPPESHLEPRASTSCPDCGRLMCRCAECQNAEHGIAPRGLCLCGEFEGQHYVSGVWYCGECYGELANWRAFHSILTRGEDV